MLNGKAHEMGLGPYPLVGLVEVRKRNAAASLLLLDGIDPPETRQEEKRRKAAEAAAAVTFQKAAQDCITDNRAAWGNAKHAWQWSQTLEAHVFP